ncbi:MAG: hypothetical protein PSV16_15880 [Flavobacterium sp.]|nr:hypothetical protein [Flavobacterium sp.]
MKKIIFQVTIFLMVLNCFAQDNTIGNRLSALRNSGIYYFNIDGYSITAQTFSGDFKEKNLKKTLRKYGIKDKDVKAKDDSLSLNNLYVRKSEKVTEQLSQENSYYFVEDKYGITVIVFSAINKYDKKFERDFVEIVLKEQVPKTCFTEMAFDSINFAGRKIKLGSDCYWTNVNTVQCPYNGEMNWSVHKDYDDAKRTVAYQLQLTKEKKGGKVISETTVAVIFEGTEVQATKIIYDIKGINSLLAGMSGGKTLTVFYVAAPVRGNFVSCVLSFWNNDNITENGLSPLLEEVMVLKK